MGNYFSNLAQIPDEKSWSDAVSKEWSDGNYLTSSSLFVTALTAKSLSLVGTGIGVLAGTTLGLIEAPLASIVNKEPVLNNYANFVKGSSGLGKRIGHFIGLIPGTLLSAPLWGLDYIAKGEDHEVSQYVEVEPENVEETKGRGQNKLANVLRSSSKTKFLDTEERVLLYEDRDTTTTLRIFLDNQDNVVNMIYANEQNNESLYYGLSKTESNKIAGELECDYPDELSLQDFNNLQEKLIDQILLQSPGSKLSQVLSERASTQKEVYIE